MSRGMWRHVALCGDVWRSSRSFHWPRVQSCALLPLQLSQFPIPISTSVCNVRRYVPMSDRTSKVLAEDSLPGEPRIYDAILKRSEVPLTTLYHRRHGRCSREKKAQS